MLNEAQRETLQAVCDTVVPSIERPGDPHGVWARKASDLGVPQMLEDTFAEMPPEQKEGMLQLLDGLTAQQFAQASQLSREQILRNVGLLGTQAAAGVGALIGLTLFYNYGAPDPETGQNPNWAAYGYPGPIAAPSGGEKPIKPLVPDDGALELEADVCIVGSGAGGGVIAGTLAGQGLRVVVLEAGGYFDESDFNQLELWAYQNLYWRGGPQQTADLNVTLQAGAGLGGGTVINWTNCLRTHPWVREEWAAQGLDGLDGPDFDRHLDTVLTRISATDQCSELNGPQEKMLQGAQQLGWSWRTIVRNTDKRTYSPETAAYIGFGDQSGSKQSTQKTFLRDAYENGAAIVTRCFVERVLVEGGRAAGVEGTWADPETGRSARVTVRAPRVVVAAGALESPALLLRTGIGGPATGKNLRLHPCTAVFGIYGDDLQAWWGAPHAGLCDEFADAEDGYGFLIEGAQYAPGLIGSALPFTNPVEHKELMEKVRYGGTFIGLLRDHGGGEITIDEAGQAVPWYSLEDELDVRNTKRAIDAQIRIHAAGGAREIYAMAAGAPRWRSGEDLDAFIAGVQEIPLRFGGWRLFAAHQMGTCRMGEDPSTSVANPLGELHDTPGVWIGDTSAFPTSSGTNPMVTAMGLAHRTAEAILATSGETRLAGATTT
jgi:choline dehydrogenase-like flavoprotein